MNLKISFVPLPSHKIHKQEFEMKAQATKASAQSLPCEGLQLPRGCSDASLLYSQLTDGAVAHRKKLDVSCNLGLKQYNFT